MLVADKWLFEGEVSKEMVALRISRIERSWTIRWYNITWNLTGSLSS